MTYLPKGTHVLSATDTRNLLNDIPHYAFGTIKNVSKKIGKGVRAGVQKVKDWASEVWANVSDPSKLLNLAFSALGIKRPDNSTTAGKVARGAFNLIKEKAITFIKDKTKDLFSFGGNVSGNVKKWIAQAIGISGVPASWAGPLATIAMKESGGNPRAINLWDINAKRGTPSMGLMQTIRPTFNAHKRAGFNDIWNPVHNILAAINYIKSRYGNVFNVPGIRNMARGKRYVGYATGGLIKNDGLYRLAEGGYPEFVIPTDPRRRTDAMKLLALAGKEIGNKRPSQLPNVNTESDDRLLNAVLEQNEILMKLLEKDIDVYLDKERVGRGVAEPVKQYLERSQIKKLRGRGIVT